jgi:hypothetical protein
MREENPGPQDARKCNERVEYIISRRGLNLKEESAGRWRRESKSTCITTHDWWKLPTLGEHNTPGIYTQNRWDKRKIIIIKEGY